ncbi:hypothetical protein ACIP4Q_00115 [Streptomyces massasporeus]
MATPGTPGSAYGVAPGVRPAHPGRGARTLALAGAGRAAAGADAGLMRLLCGR